MVSHASCIRGFYIIIYIPWIITSFEQLGLCCWAVFPLPGCAAYYQKGNQGLVLIATCHVTRPKPKLGFSQRKKGLAWKWRAPSCSASEITMGLLKGGCVTLEFTLSYVVCRWRHCKKFAVKLAISIRPCLRVCSATRTGPTKSGKFFPLSLGEAASLYKQIHCYTLNNSNKTLAKTHII